MNSVIIVAGGKGVRMGGSVPKQFIEVGGRPVLMHTLSNFHQYDSLLQLILVLPSSQQEYWASLCSKYSFDVQHLVANGGDTRFHSVKSGLSFVDKRSRCVMVHDGVRPFVAHTVIEECFREARLHKAVVPVVSPTESIRCLTDDGQGNSAVDRSLYRLVQTPQTFDAQLLRKAYEQDFCDDFTDDASVVERSGGKIKLVAGNSENIKITMPFDLRMAEVLIREKRTL